MLDEQAIAKQTVDTWGEELIQHKLKKLRIHTKTKQDSPEYNAVR